MRGNALQEGQRVADPVGGVRRQRGRAQAGVHGQDLLQQAGYDAEAVPQVGRELGEGLPLLAQLRKRVLPAYSLSVCPGLCEQVHILLTWCLDSPARRQAPPSPSHAEHTQLIKDCLKRNL